MEQAIKKHVYFLSHVCRLAAIFNLTRVARHVVRTLIVLEQARPRAKAALALGA
jgi:hypothetical protein